MKTHDPVLALIAIAVLTIEAAWILLRAVLVPVVALVLTLAQWRPAAAPITTAAHLRREPDAPLARPAPHPLALAAGPTPGPIAFRSRLGRIWYPGRFDGPARRCACYAVPQTFFIVIDIIIIFITMVIILL